MKTIFLYYVVVRHFRDRAEFLKELFDARSKLKGEIIHKDQRHIREDLLGIMLIEPKELIKVLHDLFLALGRNRLEHNAPIFDGGDGPRFVHGHSLCLSF